jgi:hypothetical protein
MVRFRLRSLMWITTVVAILLALLSWRLNKWRQYLDLCGYAVVRLHREGYDNLEAASNAQYSKGEKESLVQHIGNILSAEIQYVAFNAEAPLRNRVLHYGLDELPHLQGVSFAQTDITDNDLRNLNDVAWLQELSLARTAIGDIGLEHLRDMPRLKFLDVTNTNVSERGIERMQELLPTCAIQHDEFMLGEDDQWLPVHSRLRRCVWAYRRGAPQPSLECARSQLPRSS